jgi:hypothetical protein
MIVCFELHWSSIKIIGSSQWQQDHNSIYTTKCYKALRTFHPQHLLRSRAKLIPIGFHLGHQQNVCCGQRGDPCHVIGAARELFLRRTRKVGGQEYLLNPVDPRRGQEGPLDPGKVDRETGSRDWIERLDQETGSRDWIKRLDRETGLRDWIERLDWETGLRDGLSYLERTPRLAGVKNISSIQLAHSRGKKAPGVLVKWTKAQER